MHHGFNGHYPIQPLGLESQDYGWIWDVSAPESRLFNSMIVKLQLTEDVRGSFARKSGPSIRHDVQAPSKSHQKPSGGVKEARKRKQQHWDVKLCSDSAELILLQKLTAKVAGFSLSSDVKDATLPVFSFAPLRMGLQGDHSILFFIQCKESLYEGSVILPGCHG